MERAASNQSTVGGVVLVALGVVFSAQQAIGFDIGRYGWPVFVVLPGLALLGTFAFGRRAFAGLAVAGCVVTTAGLLLVVQNTFGLWPTWSYAWTLLVAAAGLGLRLQGERLGQARTSRVGLYLLAGGLLGFVVFAAFFELFINLSHLPGGATQALRGMVAPAVLILAGLYLVTRGGPRQALDA